MGARMPSPNGSASPSMSKLRLFKINSGKATFQSALKFIYIDNDGQGPCFSMQQYRSFPEIPTLEKISEPPLDNDLLS